MNGHILNLLIIETNATKLTKTFISCPFLVTRLAWGRSVKIDVGHGAHSQQTTIYLWFEPVHEISNIEVCETSKSSDQPAHTRSLIRAFLSKCQIVWNLLFSEGWKLPFASIWKLVRRTETRLLWPHTVNSEIFASVLFLRNFLYAIFRENKILAKWRNNSVVYWYRWKCSSREFEMSQICLLALFVKINSRENFWFYSKLRLLPLVIFIYVFVWFPDYRCTTWISSWWVYYLHSNKCNSTICLVRSFRG